MGLGTNEGSSALIVAHPGHELILYGWMLQRRPTVFVLTDGSGHRGESRLASTTRILRELNAKPGSVYGRMTDKQLYFAVLEGDLETFAAIVEEIASGLVNAGANTVVGDAME